VAALRLLQGSRRGGRQQFDPVGALLLALGIGSLVLGLSFGQEWGWTSARLLAALAVGVVALVALVSAEQIAGLQGTFVGAFHAALLVCASLAAIGIFTALVRGPEPGRESRNGAGRQVEPPRQVVLPVSVPSAPGRSGRSGK